MVRTATFSDALWALKDGRRVSREGWNGKGMFLFLVSAHGINHAPRLRAAYVRPADIPQTVTVERLLVEPFVAMKTADNKIVPWLASQTDLLTDDWCVLD